MADLLTFANLGNLVMLCFLQAVLGFDNLLYVSIESQRAPVAQQSMVRRWGILIAIAMRIVLLFAMVHLIDWLAEPFFVMNWEGVLTGGVNFATLVFIFGGIFIIYTAVKEISHMLTLDHVGTDIAARPARSAGSVIAMIVLMNMVFSFDSILSAIAVTRVFPVLAAAIVISGLAMLLLADGVTRFLEKNRMYEVLGLFILLIVGVVLLGEAGPAAAHAMENEELWIHVFGHSLVPMSKTTFYFSVVVLVIVEALQSGYKRKLNAERRAAQGGGMH